MVAGRPAWDRPALRGSPAATMGREDPAPGAERRLKGQSLTAAGTRHGQEQARPGARELGLGTPGTGILDGCGEDNARLSAARRGSRGRAAVGSARVRACLSPSRLRADRKSVV